MPIYSRQRIAEHFCDLLKKHPRVHAVRMTASTFGQCASTVESVVLNQAVEEYRAAISESKSPAAIVGAAVSHRFALTARELMRAVEEQCTEEA